MPMPFRRRRPAVDLPPPAEAAGGRPPIGLIVGLGNPGKEYSGNRHNLGQRCINRLARRAGAELDQRGRLASSGLAQIGGRCVILAKPRTYVNNSGNAVRELLRRHQLRPEQLLVVYDELDLPVGVVRVRERGSAGGQNGMRSIIAALGSQEFFRVRIGIGRPTIGGAPTWDPERIVAHVLADPPEAERRLLEDALDEAVERIEALLNSEGCRL